MVVLSLGSRPPDRARDLADLLGIELNPFGFCATTKLSPLGTSQPGIYVAGAFSAPKAMAETILDSVGVAGRVMEQLSAHVGEFASGREYPFLWGGEELPPERDVSDEEPRVGVFVCRCRPAISDVVDTEALAEYSRGLEDVVCVETVDYACLPEGQERFQQMVAEHGINRAVVAACSHRTHAALFQRLFRQQGLNPYFVELANVREQCAWAHPDDPTGATRKAKEMVRLACASARLSRPVRREGLEPTRRALIIGGGLAGMTSALNIADAGFDVTLVEREAELGGNLRRLFYLGEDVAEDPQELLWGLAERVTGHDRIDVLTEATLTSHEGSLGAFHSQVATDAGPVAIDHGVTIVATGGREYQGDEYLHGVDDRVITNLTLEETLAHHPERAQELEQVVFIQCVGRPDPFVRCSRTCCTNTMKNALRLKTLNPECQVVVLYKDIMTFGFRETLYTEARERGVLFVRFDYDQKPAVRVDEVGALAVDAWEPSLAQTITLRPDVVSLSMPPSPAEGTSDLADVLDVPLSSEAFFMETHPKMRPMDFAREGVFVSGLAHYPKFVEETIASAQAVAGRALQVLSTPRLFIGGVVSVVDQEKCVGCLTCVRTCPFGVPKVRYEDVGVGGLQGAAYIDPASCTGCGICTAECPAKAIQLGAFHDEQIIGLPLGAWAAEPVAA
jgi:heterodisulfide reductase subunit A-like polyferredoxin